MRPLYSRAQVRRLPLRWVATALLAFALGLGASSPAAAAAPGDPSSGLLVSLGLGQSAPRSAGDLGLEALARWGGLLAELRVAGALGGGGQGLLGDLALGWIVPVASPEPPREELRLPRPEEGDWAVVPCLRTSTTWPQGPPARGGGQQDGYLNLGLGAQFVRYRGARAAWGERTMFSSLGLFVLFSPQPSAQVDDPVSLGYEIQLRHGFEMGGARLPVVLWGGYLPSWDFGTGLRFSFPLWDRF